MSGGHFDYSQFHIRQIADAVESIIEQEENPVEDEYTYEFTENTLAEFRNGLLFLRMAEIYAQRIDWLISGDDGEETFHKRLAEDLKEMRNT